MNTKKIITGLFAVVLFQLFILLFEYVGAVYPIWTGQEVLLKTKPVDPRSMFRGNYARLRYDISTIPGTNINNERTPRNGEIVFITLKKDHGNIYSFDDASLKKPAEGLFIRGRIKRYSSKSTIKKYRVKYGIEAFFAPKEKAIQLEKMLRNSAVAKIKIARNGKAALIDVVNKE